MEDVEALCAVLREEIGPGSWSDRDLVETLVSRGRLTPERAEAWAIEHDEPPFEDRPDPSIIDPMKDPYWTLPMALAWIIWRTPNAVRLYWSSYVLRCRDWIRRRSGFELTQRKLPSIFDVLCDAKRAEVDGISVIKMSSEDATHQLANSLKEGRPLVARHGVKSIEIIPARSWDLLCSFVNVPERSKPDAMFDGEGKLLFERVRVDRDDVLLVWPALPMADLIKQVGQDLTALGRPPVRTETDDAVPATTSGSRPRLTGYRLRTMMNDPRMDDTTNSDSFLSETRQRAKVQGYSVDQAEVRALYKEMYGRKSAGRPSRKSRPDNPVE